jgi:hypothetical protein
MPKTKALCLSKRTAKASLQPERNAFISSASVSVRSREGAQTRAASSSFVRDIKLYLTVHIDDDEALDSPKLSRRNSTRRNPFGWALGEARQQQTATWMTEPDLSKRRFFQATNYC